MRLVQSYSSLRTQSVSTYNHFYRIVRGATTRVSMPPFLLPYPGIVGVHGPHDPASTTTSTGTTTLANYSTTSELF